MITRNLSLLLLLPFIALGREENTAKNLPKTDNKPLSFIENKGQVVDQFGKHRKDIDAKLEANGLNVFVGDGAIHYQWSRETGASKTSPLPPFEGGRNLTTSTSVQDQASSIESYRMDVELVGANEEAIVVYGNKQNYFENYYLPQCPDGATAYAYNTITYKNVYPGIDWVLYSRNNELKYDFIVHPGGDAKQIKLRYNGATALYLKEGALIAETPFGNITEQKPYSYDAVTGKQVLSAFVLKGDELSFDIALHDHSIVIDPAVEWATYYGDGGYEWGHSVTTDTLGNVYFAGSSSSLSNIATAGAHQTNFGGGTSIYGDGFLVKFNAAGVRQWATYYGADQRDELQVLSYDKNGFIYAAGETYSDTLLASPGAHQMASVNGTQIDLFLVKFNLSGVRQWGTYYGGPGTEGDVSIACDATGNIFLVGGTGSHSNIATSGTFQPIYANGNPLSASTNGFAVKFSPVGVRLWGTYYGYVGNAQLNVCAVDDYGNLYAGGIGSDTGYYSTPGCFQPSPAGNLDGILVKFSPNGARLWGTQYGGTNLEWLTNIICDGTDIYIGGHTLSNNNLATPGAFQTSNSGNYDSYIAKFDSAGQRKWGSFLGGTGEDKIQSLSIGPAGNLYVAGVTKSTTGLATAGAMQASYGGGTHDLFLAEFTPNGQRKWASYYGASGDDDYSHYRHTNLAYNLKTDRMFMCGMTTSTSGITTAGGHQVFHGGGAVDAMLIKLKPDTMVYIPRPHYDSTVCAGDTLRLLYRTVNSFNSSNTFIVQLSNASGSFTSPVAIGTKAQTSGDSIVCVIPAATVAGNNYRLRIISTSPAQASEDNYIKLTIKAAAIPTASYNGPICEGTALNLSASAIGSNVTYSWSGPGSFSSSQQSPSIATATTLHSGDYVVTTLMNGCDAKDTVTVLVKPLPPTPTASNNGPICAGAQLLLTSTFTTAGASYSWTGPGSYSSTQQNPTIASVTVANAGIYSVSSTLNGCSSAVGTTTVVINPIPATPTATANNPVCAGGILTLTANSSTSGVAYKWNGPGGFNSTAQNPTISPAALTHAGVYHVQAELNGCVSSAGVVTVTVNTVSSLGVYPSPNDTICQGGTVNFVSVPFNAGTSPQYQWYKNGVLIPGATNATYNTSALASGDTIHCIMTVTGVCADPLAISGSKIGITVLPLTPAPIVSISADPGLLLSPWQLVKFTAIASNAGALPKYQWKRNSQDVIGATGDNWSANNLSNGDTISCVVTSSVWCATPTNAASNKMVVNIKTGIKDIGRDGKLKLYPNPNNGSFVVHLPLTPSGGGHVDVAIVDILGKTVYSNRQSQITNHQLQITLPSSVANGVYMLKLQHDGGTEALRFTVTR